MRSVCIHRQLAINQRPAPDSRTTTTPPTSAPTDLSKPVDVYCEWIDECERINGLAEGVEGDADDDDEDRDEDD